MDKYKCLIWGIDLCSGKSIRQGLLGGIDDPFAGTIYKKYKEKGCKNIFFLKYGIESGCSPYIRGIKDNQFEVYNPQAGGMYRADYEYFLCKLYDDFNNEEKMRLSGWIAKENLKGNIPFLQPKNNISMKDVVEKLDSIPDTPDEKAGLLLKGLAALYPDKGKNILLNINKISNQKNNPSPFLYALSYSSNKYDFRFLLFDFLIEELNYIKKEYSFDEDTVNIKITPKGWKRVNEIENKNLKESSKTAFIAMWIDSSTNALKEEIKKGVDQAGYRPSRIDEKEYNNKIDDEILFDIDQSSFVVCDLTSEPGKPRGSVYFEAGYAMKSKKRDFIIWTCNEDLKNEIAFDVKGYNFIFWYRDEQGNFWVRDGDEKMPLKDKIQKRIEGIIYKYKKPEKGVQRYEENTI